MMDKLTNWEIAQDPTELRCKAIKAQYEYEPGEFASVWVCREVAAEHAPLLRAAPALLAACRMVLDDPGLTASANDVLRAAIALAEGRAS
jgi:hypothetical protein